MTVSVLTIAGSDPSGGAGVQADLRVFAALGVAGLSAITALTVQNSQGVQAVHPIAPELLAAQVEAVLSDSAVQAVKIGMLGGAAQVQVVAEMLRRFHPPHVVLDPVLASTGGVPLLDAAGRRILIDDLLPLCHLVTPNLPELAALTGMSTLSGEERYAAARHLQSLGARRVLIKGGHLRHRPIDLLVTEKGARRRFTAPRIETAHTHGTGCLLSSAIAAYLALGLALEPAVQKSKALLTFALRSPVITGQARGYPDVFAISKDLRNQGDLEPAADQILRPGLYVLTDSDLRPDRSPVEIVQAALAGGARVVQLRDKRLPTSSLVALAKRLSALTKAADAQLIVNDRVDVAWAADADGVHLGPDDMPPADARRLLGSQKLIGVSVSSVEEAKQVAAHASYFGVGAIFGSRTKSDAGPPIGVERIRQIKQAFPNHPIVAIGGIHAESIGAVAQAGADAAAVVSAVVCAPDMTQATRDLLRRFALGRQRPEPAR